ncbi:iron-containing alcohol dehydrogenase, partial [uncultured Helicobacter sp.]
LIVRILPDLAENLQSFELRESMLYASMYAALAFSNTQTALAHAISYPITMRFGVPHGLACSFSIPLLLDCLPKCEAREILSPLSGAIQELFATLKVSTNPRDYGLDSVMIEEIFASLNARAKNGVFELEEVKRIFLLVK